MPKSKLLIVDDIPSTINDRLRKDKRFDVTICEFFEDAMNVLDEEEFDVAIINPLYMAVRGSITSVAGDLWGLKPGDEIIAEAANNLGPSNIIILLTTSNPDIRNLIRETGEYNIHTLVAPFPIKTLVELVEQILADN